MNEFNISPFQKDVNKTFKQASMANPNTIKNFAWLTLIRYLFYVGMVGLVLVSYFVYKKINPPQPIIIQLQK